METKILLGLLMLFGIIFRGSESLSQKNIDASLDRHFRQKRVIDTSHDRDEKVLRQEVPYVVLLIKPNGDIQCTGIILRARIILTAAHCVLEGKVFVVTGGRISQTAKSYSVVKQYVHEGFDPHSKTNDLALLIINEPIDLINSYHRPIELYEGKLPQNSLGLVTGWGCTSRGGKEFPTQPLSILVPILSLQQCQRAYRNEATITSHNICTHYINRTKTCWFGDSGGPLVVNGHLVGLLSWFRSTDELKFPDVFMNLMDGGYKMWVEAWVNHFHSHYHG